MNTKDFPACRGKALFFEDALMNDTVNPEADKTVIMDGAAIGKHLRRIAQEIAASMDDIESLVILGILRRGRPLADRLACLIGEQTGCYPPVGSLSTTLYRDDTGKSSAIKDRGHTHFAFNLDGRTVLLVDDVLAAGRTIRAALGEVMDYGRPDVIRLACLIDRGGRELPIQPDFLGWTLGTEPGEWVSVRLHEMDGEDVVWVEKRVEKNKEEGA
jgi:pyrimidine operon attenuation protein / uracil phosphoribosyltransferase